MMTALLALVIVACAVYALTDVSSRFENFWSWAFIAALVLVSLSIFVWW
ncbi:MAG: hypothetical protein M1457_03025 [bacterium]|nr:hypothetical protein [bacterium]